MWTCYKVYLEAKTPIHIGYGAKIGIVDRTRYYIPAKSIWGALTSSIARSIMKNYNPKVYQGIGEFLNENTKFSYFYPVEYKRTNGKIHVQQVFAPCYEEEGLKFGVRKDKKTISLEEFERIFISSFVSTAIDKTSKSAKKGSLHEIEFIRDKVECEGDVKPTIFMGYIFLKNFEIGIKTCDLEALLTFTDSIEINGAKLNDIWVGGERNYGFGRTTIFLEKLNDKMVNLFDSTMLVDVSKEQLTVRVTSREKSLALSHVDLKNVTLIRGDIEPLIGREWSEKGSGQRISQIAKICITPGSLFISDTKISIGNFGIWI